jgi:ubiquitin C-terminal hydrolase
MEISESPISKIFGGKIRSILSCQGSKDSVTSEPFQSLPLDITPEHVRSVEDALENMTMPETMHDYVSAKGVNTNATKQVFLETLPPVLVLHVKRFVYDNIGGVQKLQKHVRYDLELNIKSGMIRARQLLLAMIRPFCLSLSKMFTEWISAPKKPAQGVKYKLFGGKHFFHTCALVQMCTDANDAC